LSVVGFGDSALAAMSWPPLTTIRRDEAAAARCAVRRLVAAIEGRAAPPAAHPAAELIVRGSTGPRAGADPPATATANGSRAVVPGSVRG
jgi:DNA-binding LacI/PurR family transcriptional regulator